MISMAPVGLALFVTAVGTVDIPQGYEVVDAFGGQIEVNVPRLNDCGEIVNLVRTDFDNTTEEIVYYENGIFAQLTTNELQDVGAEINNVGQITWRRTLADGTFQHISYESGAESIFQEADDLGDEFVLNDAGHATWRSIPSQDCNILGLEAQASIHYFDGLTALLIIDDGFSNQSPRINNSDQILWTHYRFPCGGGFGDWDSTIYFFEQDVITPLPPASQKKQGPTPQLPRINNLGEAVWQGSLGIEYWDGINDPVLLLPNPSGTHNLGPDTNDWGDIAYTGRLQVDELPQVWILRNGTTYQITDDPDFSHIRPDLNNDGEMVWWWHPNGNLIPSGVKYMRRIRNGDIDNDGLVAFADFAGMPDCMTGVGEFARLCACRFYDIEHDRDVDVADALKMQAAFDRPVPSPTECCTAHASPGCDDALVESCVCGMAPDCCNVAWETGCVALADAFCTSCFGLWDLQLSVQSNGANGISVAPGTAFSYEIVGVLSNTSSQGLAGFAFDLGLQGGPFDTPASPGSAVSSFVFPEGLSNPTGFGGLIDGGVLRQIGGLQNTFGGVASPVEGELPSGDVVTGIGNEPVVLATGTATAPDQLGTFTLFAQNILANVLISGPGPENQWQTQAAGAGPATPLIITVEPQVPIPAVSTWGAVVLCLLMMTVATGVFGRGVGRLKVEG